MSPGRNLSVFFLETCRDKVSLVHPMCFPAERLDISANPGCIHMKYPNTKCTYTWNSNLSSHKLSQKYSSKLVSDFHLKKMRQKR